MDELTYKAKKAAFVTRKVDKYAIKHGLNKRQRNNVSVIARIYVNSGEICIPNNPLYKSMKDVLIQVCDRWMTWYDRMIEIGKKGATFGKYGGAPKGNQNASKKQTLKR